MEELCPVGVCSRINNLDVENHRDEEDDKVESGNDVARIVTEGQKNLFMMY